LAGDMNQQNWEYEPTKSVNQPRLLPPRVKWQLLL
jgi:hypothetical protein